MASKLGTTAAGRSAAGRDPCAQKIRPSCDWTLRKGTVGSQRGKRKQKNVADSKKLLFFHSYPFTHSTNAWIADVDIAQRGLSSRKVAPTDWSCVEKQRHSYRISINVNADHITARTDPLPASTHVRTIHRLIRQEMGPRVIIRPIGPLSPPVWRTRIRRSVGDSRYGSTRLIHISRKKTHLQKRKLRVSLTLRNELHFQQPTKNK